MVNFLIEEVGQQISDGEGAILTKLCDSFEKTNIKIAEIGSWTGYSTSFLGKFAKRTDSIVYAIDWFGGCGPTTNLESCAQKHNIYDIFMNNMHELEIDTHINVIKQTSEKAVDAFADEFFDLIFIDANHIYEFIKRDIDLWFPKVKTGGIFCGHDCECKKSVCALNVEEFLQEDFVKGFHPGVIKAVSEKFNENFNIDERIWWLKK